MVAAGWLSGAGPWENGDAARPGERVYFDLWVPLMTAAAGPPLAVLAGLLLPRHRRASRIAGLAVLAVTAIVLTWLASFASYGGFCLDSGDRCITSWPSRLAVLGVGLGCLACGHALERWGARRATRAT